VGADAEAGAYEPKPIAYDPTQSPALSQANQPCSPKGRRIAVLIADGFESADLAALSKAASSQGALVELVSTRVGKIKDSGGKLHMAPFSIYTVDSVLFDALYLVDGVKSVENLSLHINALRFLQNAYVHCKPVGISGSACELLKLACPKVNPQGQAGLLVGLKISAEFVGSLSRHRYWERENTLKPGFEEKPDV
jgi:catalase